MEVFVAHLGRSLGLPSDTDEAAIRAALDASTAREDALDRIDRRYFSEEPTTRQDRAAWLTGREAA